MHEPDHPDPWASLAESLGVGPGSEPQGQPAPPPARPAAHGPAGGRPKPKRPEHAQPNWDDLAADLGVAPSAGDRSAAPPPQRPSGRAEPPRAADVRPPREDRGGTERHDERTRFQESASADRAPQRQDSRGEADAAPTAGDEDGGERRGRRRRGRRGGRGRRDGAVADRPERSSQDAIQRRRDDADASSSDRPQLEDDWRDIDEPRDAEGGETQASLPPRDDGEDRPRRRRRRGRRGGRGRSRGERADAPGGGGSRGAAAPRDLDEEPLPASYGTRASARGPESRDQGNGQRSEGERSRAGEGDRAAGGSGRRRRRRRGGDGRPAADDAGRGRRSRRGGDVRSGSSRSSRVRRADFAPVVGAFDEDDEGLEFLGVEEAGREPGRRESRPDVEGVLAESGLDNVRDVPSWVEAIGIVIAGNLDARTRGRGDGGRRDR